MAKKSSGAKTSGGASVPASREQSIRATAREDSRPTRLKSSVLLDTHVIYCGDNLEPIIKRSRKSSAS
jgi:hypothetical protein